VALNVGRRPVRPDAVVVPAEGQRAGGHAWIFGQRGTGLDRDVVRRTEVDTGVFGGSRDLGT
jgi:hypothetical protein